MTILTLNNGTSFEVAETSTPSAIIINGNAETITNALAEITTDTLKNATLGDTTLVNKIATGGTFANIEGNTVSITFTTREKTEMELLFGKVQDVEDGLAEVADIVAGM